MEIRLNVDDPLFSKESMEKAVKAFKKEIVYRECLKNWEKGNAFVENFNMITRCAAEGIIDCEDEYLKINEITGLEVKNVSR